MACTNTGFDPEHKIKQDMVVHTNSTNTQETEAKGLEVHEYP